MAFVFKPVVTRRKDGRQTRRRTRFYWIGFTAEVDGEDRREALVLPDGQRVSDRETAEAELRRRVNLRQRKAAGLVDRQVESAAVPWRKLVADFIRFKRTQTHGGRRLSRAHLKQIIRAGKWAAKLGIVKLADLTAERIGKALHGLALLDKSARTCNVYRSRLYGICEFALKTAKVLNVNPVKEIGTLSGDAVKVRRALSPDEANRLLAVAREHDPARALYYETALMTGLRWGEIAALRWADLILSDRPGIRLRAATTKAGRGDDLPLHLELARKLVEVKPPFARPGDRVFKSVPIRRTFLRDCERAGVPIRDERGRTIDRHALRTTFVTWLLKGNVNARTAQSLARHSSIELTTRNYTDPRLLDQAGALLALPDLGTPMPERETARATGTDDMTAEPDTLRPVVVGVVVNSGDRPRNAGNGTSDGVKADHPESAVSVALCKGKQGGSRPYSLGVAGLEPAASCMSSTRSSQLS
jgi:integrase